MAYHHVSEVIRVEKTLQLHILCFNGINRGSFIGGHSVHNQRIERLWSDLYVGVLDLYKQLFMYLESVHLLNPCNELDLFALHYVYTERINNHIAVWTDAWNRHPISSEGNKSPV